MTQVFCTLRRKLRLANSGFDIRKVKMSNCAIQAKWSNTARKEWTSHVKLFVPHRMQVRHLQNLTSPCHYSHPHGKRFWNHSAGRSCASKLRLEQCATPTHAWIMNAWFYKLITSHDKFNDIIEMKLNNWLFVKLKSPKNVSEHRAGIESHSATFWFLETL